MRTTGFRNVKRIILKGYWLEVAWHYGREQYCAEITPDNNHDKWVLLFSDNRKDLIGQVRQWIARYSDPSVDSAYLKVTEIPMQYGSSGWKLKGKYRQGTTF